MQAIKYDFSKAKTSNLDDDIIETLKKNGTDTGIIPIQKIIAGPLKVITTPSTCTDSREK